MILFPAIDLKEGRCVRLVQGDMAQAIVWFEKAYAAMDRLYTAEPQRIGPWHASLGILIGEAYEGAGELEKAADWYRLVLEQTPFEPVAEVSTTLLVVSVKVNPNTPTILLHN